MKSIAELARRIDPITSKVAGMVRRMAVTATARVLWQIAGHRNLDGTTETIEAELFNGVGIFARPPNGSKTEAIVLMVGGANSPAIVATRDEKTRAASAGKLQDDETALYNSKSIVLMRKNGIVEIRSVTGVAQPLATKADLDALASYVAGHVHVVTTSSGSGSAAAPVIVPPSAIGTIKTRME